ncbi:hypothetical protein CROQUDRAFT_664858 [Cronartium quercuum f. sp. fusiforme G11]|uniref:Uncharacterized protein n=1 Tax=Cronartium quercuum f. sp. fusiforme G11 TaxID=708437 RepID=A0A9P6N7F6_9BASI|nr:hypothetical protein CROQUDRAFT_664858 [Cronartium quercuum f. sp. fusiforme G11]
MALCVLGIYASLGLGEGEELQRASRPLANAYWNYIRAHIKTLQNQLAETEDETERMAIMKMIEEKESENHKRGQSLLSQGYPPQVWRVPGEQDEESSDAAEEESSAAAERKSSGGAKQRWCC